MVRRDWMQADQMIFENIERISNQVKLSLDHMEMLLHTLSLVEVAPIVKKNKENLIELPLVEWMLEIEKYDLENQVVNVDSLVEFIERFKVFYDEQSLVQEDPRESSRLVKCALKDMKRPPNELQLAVASCAVQLLATRSR